MMRLLDGFKSASIQCVQFKECTMWVTWPARDGSVGRNGQSWRERVQPYRERWYDSFGHQNAQGAYIFPFLRADHRSARHGCPGAGLRQAILKN